MADSIERRALAWIASGDTGMSSEAICYHMIGMPCDGSYPLDPDDLGRCLRLLGKFPEWEARIGEMSKYGDAWTHLAGQWHRLAQMMEDEVGIDWRKGRVAPLTYSAMKNVIEGKP